MHGILRNCALIFCIHSHSVHDQIFIFILTLGQMELMFNWEGVEVGLIPMSVRL